MSLLPNKLLRRHSLDFRRALDAWDQLVARGYVLHVDPRHLSLDGERELKNKDAVNNSTHFRFEPSRFAPFALRCAALAVRGLPPVDNGLLRRHRRLPDVGLRAHPRRRPSGERGGARDAILPERASGVFALRVRPQRDVFINSAGGSRVERSERPLGQLGRRRDSLSVCLRRASARRRDRACRRPSPRMSRYTCLC